MHLTLLKIALLISLGNLLGCTQQRTFTITPVNALPTGKTKVAKKYRTTVVAGATRSRNVVEVYDIGSTVDADGDLVGKHQLFRVVESSHWVLASHVKSPDIPAPTPAPHQSAPKKEKAPPNTNTASQPTQPGPDLTNALAGQHADPLPDQSNAIPDDITKASPAEEQALKEFGNVKPAPAP